MSCVREGSLEPPYRPHNVDNSRHVEGRTGRFFRGLRRMFKRRGSGTRVDASPDPKSSSTSELLDAERSTRRKEGAYGSGLSVSHDSVFTGERSGDESDERPSPGHGTFATSHRAELVAAVRRRGRGDGSDDDEDLGLPRSPPASPPTDKADKRHHAGISHSSCSDGSLLSVGSSEMDEDSSSGHHTSNHDHSNRSDLSDLYASSEPPTGVAPLSHSAAKHKMAVRPRRTHGAPRRKKTAQIAPSALPITPELNEETRCTTPEIINKKSEYINESYSTTNNMTKEKHIQVQILSNELQQRIPEDTKLKSSSLPPGLALSQLVGQTPSKLSVIESTPRSSIKRSKSSSQKPVEDTNKTHPSTSESHIYSDQSKHKHKDEEKTKKDEGKNKKEESFFSRLLLRKSGKKKKDSDDVDKKKTEKFPQYKPVDIEKSTVIPRPHVDRVIKPKINQNKVADSKGAYVQEGVYKDAYSAVKVTGVEYITDLKMADETDRMLNREIKNRYSRRDDFVEKAKKKEIDERKRDSCNLNSQKKVTQSVQKTVDYNTPDKKMISDEIPIKTPRMRDVRNDFSIDSSPKTVPYFKPNIVISASASPPKSVLHDHVKFKSTELVTEYGREKRQSQRIKHVSSTEDNLMGTGLRSIGDEFIEHRNNISKSQSFRYASESPSMNTHESQIPSLPAIVGISEQFLESWEVNYRRNVNNRAESFRHDDYSKRVSARNYDILNSNNSDNYDSLISTDSSYLDSLKTDIQPEEAKLFNTIHISVDNKRNSDISQIEAKIDDIISSPKPIIPAILKSNSLDSVKSSPEKQNHRRKTISVDTHFSDEKVCDVQKENKVDYVSVTHINREVTPTQPDRVVEIPKLKEEKAKSPGKPGVPEFLKIQLNKVDTKPPTNVVLTANVTPKKFDHYDKDDIEVEIIENKMENKVEQKPKLEHVERPIVRSKTCTNVPQSPTTPKAFFKRKSISIDMKEKSDTRKGSSSGEGSIENVFIDKSRSSFGSKSSIQSFDSNEIRTPDRHEEVVYRKKSVAQAKSGSRKDDEPELMKVFARRSLKLKDSEADCIAQEIAEIKKEEDSKAMKNEQNDSIKSRDSDKENDSKSEDNRLIDIAARVSQFGAQYQRSCSVTNVIKRDNSSKEVNKYKKEVSDSTPEKRFRNRTFPDSTTDREDMKNLKNDAFKADSLKLKKDKSDSADNLKSKRDSKNGSVIDENGESDGSPQFKGILQMRAEWERRAQQGITK